MGDIAVEDIEGGREIFTHLAGGGREQIAKK